MSSEKFRISDLFKEKRLIEKEIEEIVKRFRELKEALKRINVRIEDRLDEILPEG